MRRTALLACATTVVVLVAGCSSSGSPTKTSGSGTSAAALADKVSAALDALTSAHLDIDTGALGGKSTADVTLKAGAATATDVHETESGTPVEVVTVGGKSYAKLPNAGAKPWLVVSPTSSNPTVKSLATTPGVTDVLTSLSVVSGLVRSAQDVKDRGTDATGHHYTLSIDPKKGTGNSRLDGMLSLLGSTKIPADLWLDPKNRPVRIVLHIAFGSGNFPVSVQVSNFDAPLTITAPSASEIGSG